MEAPQDPTLADYQRAAALRAAVRVFLQRGEQAARRAGLTPQRQLLLLMIKGAPDGRETATVTELAERLRLAQSTVTELVARAEAVGLLEREGSEHDGRVVHLRLTAEGERRLAATVAELRADREALVDVLAAQREGAGSSPARGGPPSG
jgi:DNA-binding MarR family transcriptional regulator